MTYITTSAYQKTQICYHSTKSANSKELSKRHHDLTLSPKFHFEVSSNIVCYLYKAHSSTISVSTIHYCKYFEEKIIVVFAICVHSLKVCECVYPKSFQWCPALCDLMDCSSPGSSVHGILQARRLEWVAMPSSRGSSRPRDQTQSFMSSALADGLFTTTAMWEAFPLKVYCYVFALGP